MKWKDQVPFLLIISVLITGGSLAWATSEISITSSQTTTTYSEATDSQSTELKGSGNTINYRLVENLPFFNLGVEWGNRTLKGNTDSHEVEMKTDFIGLVAGLNFRFSPTWLEYTLDLGYRLNRTNMGIRRTSSNNKIDNYEIGDLGQQSFSRLGIKIFLGSAVFIGFHQEQQSDLFKKTMEGLTPEVKSANSTLLTLGYRFGVEDSGIIKSDTRSGPTNYNNPCRLFSACE